MLIIVAFLLEGTYNFYLKVTFKVYVRTEWGILWYFFLKRTSVLFR